MKVVIDQARETALWRILDKARGIRNFGDFPVLVRHLRERGERLTCSELMYLQERTAAFGGPLVVPQSVAYFFLCLLHQRGAGSVLDPFGGLGLLGAWLAENLPGSRIDVVSPLAEAREVTQSLGLATFTLHVGGMRDVENKLAGQYDAVVAIPPINRPIERRQYSADGGRIELADDPSSLAIADLAARLQPEGFIAFVVAPRFGSEGRPDSVRRNLQRFGLHLSALIRFRPGTFAGTSMPFELAIIDRKPREALFVGEVPDDAEAQKDLVARLGKRKQGPTPSQGRLVLHEQFHGLAALEAKERYDKLGRGKGLEPVPFSRAVPQMRVPKRRGADFERCEDDPCAVYLPQMAATRATTRQDELPARLKSYLQLLVDPTVVVPEYLAGWLNTPMGHALRQSAMVGATIPRISQSLLVESKLYLPSLADQRLGLDATREIQRVRSELSELESRVWDQPRQASNVLEAVGKVNHEERFSDWVETLPFPLASILRSYHALDRTQKDKYERLLHFFEAFTEFCVAIHVSAMRGSAAHWQPQREQIAQVLGEQHFSLARPSFGTWKAIAELMAARLRSMLGNNEERTVACTLYATADAVPLEMLAATELAGLLGRVNGFRNRWTGHGGAVAQAEAVQRHALLENDLATIREILGTKLLRYQLIEPREAEILDGPVFRCRIRRVMGSNPQLEHDTVDLTTPAKTGSLYLHNPGHDKALELIPLVQVRDTPQPASYFYNRREKASMHLVSYHFSETSEVSGASTALMGLLDEFPADPGPEEAEA